MTSEYNSTYWVKRQDIGFITGAVANTFVDWIPQANLTFSRYMVRTACVCVMFLNRRSWLVSTGLGCVVCCVLMS